MRPLHCPLSIIHYPLPIIHYPLPIIHHPLSIIHYPSSIIHCPLPIIHHPLSIIHYPSSITHSPLSIIHFPLKSHLVEMIALQKQIYTPKPYPGGMQPSNWHILFHPSGMRLWGYSSFSTKLQIPTACENGEWKINYKACLVKTKIGAVLLSGAGYQFLHGMPCSSFSISITLCYQN